MLFNDRKLMVFRIWLHKIQHFENWILTSNCVFWHQMLFIYFLNSDLDSLSLAIFNIHENNHIQNGFKLISICNKKINVALSGPKNNIFFTWLVQLSSWSTLENTAVFPMQSHTTNLASSFYIEWLAIRSS